MTGGFDGTSNVLAGKLFSIPVKGTHAHAFVTSFTGLEDLSRDRELQPCGGGQPPEKDFMTACVDWRIQLGEFLNILGKIHSSTLNTVSYTVPNTPVSEAHDGELAAFISFAMAFPAGFVALIDTYDVSKYKTKDLPRE